MDFKKTITAIFVLLNLCSLSAQHTRPYYDAMTFERSAPPMEVGRALLPGMLCFLGGAMRTDTQRGRAVQQGLFFSAGVSIGVWGKRERKFYLIDIGCGIAGAALGFGVKQWTAK